MGNRLKPQLEHPEWTREDPRHAEFLGGRWMAEVDWALTEDEVEQVRQGYRCISCMERLDPSFPEHCPVCFFPVAELQIQEFTRKYRGVEVFGPTPDSVFDDERERERWKKRNGVLVPRSVTDG